MKQSIPTFILLLSTLMLAPVYAEKPDGEKKRYKVVLEKKVSVADIKNEMQVEEPAEAAAQVAGEQTAAKPKDFDEASERGLQEREEHSRKWWKPWGKGDSEPKETESTIETAEKKSEKKIGTWWKPWGNSEPEIETSEKQVDAAEEEPKQDGKKWWKPWGGDQAQPEEIIPKTEPAQKQPKANTGKWWNPLD